MRKFIMAVAVTALGTAVLAGPAVAFDHHFSVFVKVKSSHLAGPGGNAVAFKEKLLDPKNRHNKVGRDRGKCTLKERGHPSKCHILVHLNGKIGGFGDIRVRGDLDRGPDHLVVLGGSRQFDGVAGKLTNYERGRVDKYHFDLTR